MALNLLKSGHEKGGDQIGGNDFLPPNTNIAHHSDTKVVPLLLALKQL